MDGFSNEGNGANTDTFSTIDIILYSGSTIELKYLEEDWAISYSDHAAVETGFIFKPKVPRRRSKILRIDPSLAKCVESGFTLYKEVNEMMQGLPQGWDPHMKLEFLKVCIRTASEMLQAERKQEEKLEEKIINDDLNQAIMILKNAGLTENRSNLLMNKVEDLRSRKAELVVEKGHRLPECLGSKWYNEGEKSNKYFMRLLNRPTPDDFESIPKDDGTVVSDPEQVT